MNVGLKEEIEALVRMNALEIKKGEESRDALLREFSTLWRSVDDLVAGFGYSTQWKPSSSGPTFEIVLGREVSTGARIEALQIERNPPYIQVDSRHWLRGRQLEPDRPEMAHFRTTSEALEEIARRFARGVAVMQAVARE